MRRLALALVLLAALVGGALYFSSRDYTVTITAAQIQTQVDRAFPIEKSYLGIAHVALRHPVVRLEAGSDRAGLSIDATADILGGAWQASGTGEISGKLRVKPESRELFLDEARVERLDIGGLPSQWVEPVRAASELAAREYFDRHPLYQWRRPLFPKPLAGMTVKSIAVENQALQITLGRMSAQSKP